MSVFIIISGTAQDQYFYIPRFQVLGISIHESGLILLNTSRGAFVARDGTGPWLPVVRDYGELLRITPLAVGGDTTAIQLLGRAQVRGTDREALVVGDAAGKAWRMDASHPETIQSIWHSGTRTVWGSRGNVSVKKGIETRTVRTKIPYGFDLEFFEYKIVGRMKEEDTLYLHIDNSLFALDTTTGAMTYISTPENVRDVAVTELDGAGVLLVATNRGLWTGVLNSRIRLGLQGFGGQIVWQVVVCPHDSRLLGVVAEEAVFISEDGGVSWRLVLQIPDAKLMTIFERPRLGISPAAKPFLYFASANGVLRSEDLGNTWTEANSGLEKVLVQNKR